MTEYVEVARAESERGEVVLRRRIEEHAADALELRVNGVFVMDTRETEHRDRARGGRARPGRGPPRRRGRRRARARVTPPSACSPTSGSSEVRVVEIEEALVGWMRDGTIPHGPAVLADKRLHVVDRRHRDGRRRGDLDLRPGAARRRQRARLPRPRRQRRGLRARLPGEHQADARPRRRPGDLVGHPGARAGRGPWSRSSATAPSTATTWSCRGATEQYLLYLSRRA